MNNHSEPLDRVLPTRISSIDLELLVRLFDQAADIAFFVNNALGKYEAVNDSLLNRHGLTKKEFAIGKSPSEICQGDFGRVPTEQDAKILRTGKALIDHLEMQWHRPNHPVWCLTTKLPILNSDGRVTGIIGFSRDVRLQVESTDIPAEFAAALDYFELNLNELKPPNRVGTTRQSRSRASMSTIGLIGTSARDTAPGFGCEW